MDATLVLTPERNQVARARRFVTETLRRWHSGHDELTAVLLVSELVTNAIVHAGTDVNLTVRCEDPLLTVEVRDGSRRTPRHVDATPTATSGRGIHFVSEMAVDWGVRALPGEGKVVWFTLAPDGPGGGLPSGALTRGAAADR